MPIQFPALAHLPKISEKRIAVRVSAAAERALKNGHPWLFEDAIQSQNIDGSAGDIAIIFDKKRRFLAAGLFDPHSVIRVRLLQHRKPATLDRNYFHAKLSAAIAIRATLPATDTNGYRLVHGENDALPALVIDKYDQTLVVKLYSTAWIPHLPDALSALLDLLSAERVVLRLSRNIQNVAEKDFSLRDGMLLFGEAIDAPILFRENGLLFEADPIAGQKTGFFLDQRENRARVELLSAGKSVLNVFAYSGGFSLYAARGGAKEVVSVDLSAPALNVAIRQFGHNLQDEKVAAAKHQTIAKDAFIVLAEMAKSHRRFDVVILDPPMFAQKQSQVEQALSGYKKLTQLGLAVLKRGGTLVQASCSSRVPAADFFDAVNAAAVQAGRPLQEIKRTEHPLDHPIGFPEGAYLKCLFAIAP